MEGKIQFLKTIVKMYMFEKLFATHLSFRDATWSEHEAYLFGQFPRNTLYV